MTTLAVTGGIGSGKSEVVRILAELPGVQAVNADEEARRLMIEDEDLREALIERFGAETYLPDGSLNRKGLADRVFGHPAELVALNAIVHPAVRRALLESIEEAELEGVALFVYEAALIKEINIADAFDAVLLVDAPLETRILRVMERNELSRDDVLERIQHQVSPDELKDLSEYVIENDGSLEDLRIEVINLYKQLMEQ